MWLYGLSSDSGTMAARILTGFWAGWILLNQGKTPYYTRWYLDPNPDIPWVSWGDEIPATHPHYPYGYEVEPDGPM